VGKGPLFLEKKHLISCLRACSSLPIAFSAVTGDRCWLGGRKGILPVITERWGSGVVICLERGADLHMAQRMPLPLTVSCFSKIQIGFMKLSGTGSPK